MDAHGGVGGSACTGVVDAGAAEVVPWTRAAASAGRRARDSWTLDLRGADVHASPVDARGSGGGRRARKSWTLEPRRSACTSLVDACDSRPTVPTNPTDPTGCTSPVDACGSGGAAEVSVHESGGRVRRPRVGVHATPVESRMPVRAGGNRSCAGRTQHSGNARSSQIRMLRANSPASNPGGRRRIQASHSAPTLGPSQKPQELTLPRRRRGTRSWRRRERRPPRAQRSHRGGLRQRGQRVVRLARRARAHQRRGHALVCR